MPPLRERAEDIPLLVKHFLNQLGRENNRRPKQMTPAAMDVLKRYRWRGNIRELRNTIERLIIMTEGDTIDAPDLPESVKSDKGAPRTAAAAGPAAPSGASAGSDAGTLREFKESAERAWLVEKLRENALEHLEDRRSHRHAQKQSLQEARAIRDTAGDGRIRLRLGSIGNWSRQSRVAVDSR